MIFSHHHAHAPARRDVDMTQGSITRHLIQFALPLLAGNVFQQLYNMVDTWVVGNFVSNEAFSAVGTVGPIINMLIGFFMGLSSGAGVVISQYYGAHRPEKVRDTVHTAMVLTLVLCAAFTALGLALIPAMLDLMNTPAEVLPESTAYLSIYFSGITGLLIYNMGSGILRAVGDSRRPFYFLVVSAVLNTGLDLLFVIRFHLGVAGVAWATIIAQSVSAVLVLAVLMRTDSCVRVELRRLRVHWDMLKKIVRVGIPAALQMAVTAFSNVFVQSYINHFGADCMSGWTAYTKIDQLMFLPMQSLALSATTFVGQNLGAGDTPRAQQGVRRALGISLAVTAVLMVPVLVRSPADGLLQPQGRGGGLRHPAAAVYLPLLSAVLHQPDLLRRTPGRRQQPGAHGDHAGLLCGVPPDLSVYRVPFHHQYPAAPGHGLSRRMAGVQRRHAAVLPQGRPGPAAPGGG